MYQWRIEPRTCLAIAILLSLLLWSTGCDGLFANLSGVEYTSEDAGSDDTASSGNACGGEEELSAEPGEDCGAEGLDTVWECTGDNSVGCPPDVRTLEATGILSHRAELEAEIVDPGTPTANTFGFCIREHTGSEDCDPVDVVEGAEGYSHELEGLTPGTDYTVRAYAESDQLEAYGAEWEFTTRGTVRTGWSTPDSDDQVVATDVGGESLFSYGHTNGRIRQVEMDPEGNVYSATGFGQLKKYGPGGEPLETWDLDVLENWDYSWVSGLAVDEEDTIYVTLGVHGLAVGGEPGASFELVFPGQVEPGDDDPWSVEAMAVDAEYLYLAERNASGGTKAGRLIVVDRDNPEAEPVYTYDGPTAGEIQALALGPDGSIYTAWSIGTADPQFEVRKLAREQGLLWTYEGHEYRFDAIAVDADGYAYSTDAGELNNSEVSGELHRIQSDGGLSWTYTDDEDGFIADLAVGPDGNVYIARSNEVRVLDSGGNLVTTRQEAEGSASTISVYPGRVGAFPEAWQRLTSGE